MSVDSKDKDHNFRDLLQIVLYGTSRFRQHEKDKIYTIVVYLTRDDIIYINACMPKVNVKTATKVYRKKGTKLPVHLTNLL